MQPMPPMQPLPPAPAGSAGYEAVPRDLGEQGWMPPQPQQALPQLVAAPAPTRNVRLRALAPGEAVYAALVSMQGIHTVSPGPGGTVVVKYTGDDQMVAAIVRALVTSNIPVVGVEPERNELERIFLEVTKGEVQ
jgi:ABC-2 type transport system ATP-binding protein